jgi:hypothetical protein
MSALSSMSGLSSRTTAMREASLITAINVLVAVGFSVAGLVNPKWNCRRAMFQRKPRSYSPYTLQLAPIPLAVIALVASTKVRNQQYCYWAPWQVSYSRWMRGLGCCNVTWENQLDLLSLLHSSFLLVCLLRGSVRGSVE